MMDVWMDVVWFVYDMAGVCEKLWCLCEEYNTALTGVPLLYYRGSEAVMISDACRRRCGICCT